MGGFDIAIEICYLLLSRSLLVLTSYTISIIALHFSIQKGVFFTISKNIFYDYVEGNKRE